MLTGSVNEDLENVLTLQLETDSWVRVLRTVFIHLMNDLGGIHSHF